MEQKVFVADGSPALTAFYKAILEECGIGVETFHSAAASLARLKVLKPDLMLIGGQLEDGDCISLCEAIKSEPANLLLPVIIVSSQSSAQLRLNCFQAGAIDFIHKRSGPAFLVERVRSVLERQDRLLIDQYRQRKQHKVLVAEDSKSLRNLYGELLSSMGCSSELCCDGLEAWNYLSQHDDVDLIITDIEMPELDGRALNRRVRANNDYDHIPVIVVTHRDQDELLCSLLSEGANDYITKPFVHEAFRARIQNHLRTRQLYRELECANSELRDFNTHLERRVAERTRELHDAHMDTIAKLSLLCEYKDKTTGNHVNRVRFYCEELARAIGMDDDQVEQIGLSSMMHDVGKITTPDSILNKAGRLNSDEWQQMQQHAEAGARLLGNGSFYAMARDIALAHHEKVDGSGYPRGLKGDLIPLAARLVAVADVYDALTSKRSYKEAWPPEEAAAELRRISGTHLDARLVDVFLKLLETGKLDYIARRYDAELAEKYQTTSE
ncbi:response regulator [Marinobacterium jannaschii]|uniref:response regulator n=1 Tax=Marinobacterium jannaschii TaxID=64970 RepID=UPI000684EFCE|nr:response regulator [Marinobacterium jannaschii]